MEQMVAQMAQQNEIISNQNEIITKLTENGTGNVTNNNNTTNNNTQNNTQNIFNFHTYLEENCKDAINLTQFVENIEITEKDLQYLLKNDNPKALAEIILRELGKYSPKERPLHCTDVKRKRVFEKCYDGSWEQHEDEYRTNLMFDELFKDAAEKQAGEIKSLYRGMSRETFHSQEGERIVNLACKMNPDRYEHKTKQYAGAYNEILSAVKADGKQPLDV